MPAVPDCGAAMNASGGTSSERSKKRACWQVGPRRGQRRPGELLCTTARIERGEKRLRVELIG